MLIGNDDSPRFRTIPTVEYSPAYIAGLGVVEIRRNLVVPIDVRPEPVREYRDSLALRLRRARQEIRERQLILDGHVVLVGVVEGAWRRVGVLGFRGEVTTLAGRCRLAFFVRKVVCGTAVLARASPTTWLSVCAQDARISRLSWQPISPLSDRRGCPWCFDHNRRIRGGRSIWSVGGESEHSQHECVLDNGDVGQGIDAITVATAIDGLEIGLDFARQVFISRACW